MGGAGRRREYEEALQPEREAQHRGQTHEAPGLTALV